jgi:hypothetical protein
VLQSNLFLGDMPYTTAWYMHGGRDHVIAVTLSNAVVMWVTWNCHLVGIILVFICIDNNVL